MSTTGYMSPERWADKRPILVPTFLPSVALEYRAKLRAPNKTGKGARGFPGARSVAHLATKAAVWRRIQGMPGNSPLTQANLEDKVLRSV